MYSVAIQREFEARHFLTGGDWGPENTAHAHRYLVEVEVSGPALDGHGYLVDIVDLEARLDRVLASYKNKLLNDLVAFERLNPSIEHFARIIATDITGNDDLPGVTLLRVKVWENREAWASYSEEFP